MISTTPSNDPCFQRENYRIATLDDEIRADRLCHELLRHCYPHLVEAHHLAAEEASRLCYGASYFLREYLIPDRRLSPFDATSRHIRQFAGHWYIVRNMEPNLTELTGILEGVCAFYTFCRDRELVAPEQTEQIQGSCAELDFYQNRIESFWAIADDGYPAWLAACPLED